MADLRSFRVVGYRSIRDMTAQLERVTVLVGKNGVGKSNLYRALELIRAAADRQLARAIASEGGMESVRWAGKRTDTLPFGVVLTASWDDLEYEIDIGVEREAGGPFPQDPYVKTERIFCIGARKTPLVERAGPQVKHRGADGGWLKYPHMLATNESMLSQLREPDRFPELLAVKNRVDAWRFYHTFRADFESPLRRKQVVFRTSTLDSDGGNLAATLLSIAQGPRRETLHKLVSAAFPGASLAFLSDAKRTRQEIGLSMGAHLSRDLTAAEISDGQLRYLALLAALLSDQLPEFLVLNEPETSLHPAAHAGLAEAIELASQSSQLLLVTHSKRLADAIAARRPVKVRKLRWTMERGTRMDHQVL